MGRDSLGVCVGHPTVTNRDFVAELSSAVRGGDASLPNYFGIFC